LPTFSFVKAINLYFLNQQPNMSKLILNLSKLLGLVKFWQPNTIRIKKEL